MRYFAKSVLTTPFWICLDWVGSTLRGEDYTCINYPLKFLSLGGSTSLVVQFQHSKRCTYNKPKGLQSNGEAWSTMECMLQHLLHPRPPAPPPPNSLPGLEGSTLWWMGEILKTRQRACAVRDYLDWRSLKHQGVSELHTSPPTPTEWDASLPQGLGTLCQHNFGHNSIVGGSSNAGITAICFSA